MQAMICRSTCLQLYLLLQVSLVEHGDRQVALTIQGLTEHGYLLAVDSVGTAFELHPDGNR